MNDSNMSFLPEDYVERRIERRTNIMCLSLFGVVLIAVVGAFVVTTHQRRDVERRQQEINAAYAEAARRIEQLDDLQQRKRHLLRKARVTATLVEPVPRTFILSELINRMPATVSLTEFKLTSTKQAEPTLPVLTTAAIEQQGPGAHVLNAIVAQPQITRYDVTLTLTGLAPTDVQVAQYMTDLGRCELFSDISLVFSEETPMEGQLMRRFKVEMTLDEEADARRIEPALANRRQSAPSPGQAIGAVEDTDDTLYR